MPERFHIWYWRYAGRHERQRIGHEGLWVLCTPADVQAVGGFPTAEDAAKHLPAIAAPAAGQFIKFYVVPASVPREQLSEWVERGATETCPTCGGAMGVPVAWPVEQGVAA